jgi:2-polyprenyl-3-methyl-5-hydroxy-6-metoxy-1,4-benzoquinol methylase
VYSKIKDVKQKFDYITLFHVFEHIKDPLELLGNLKNNLKKDGSILIEVPNLDDALFALYEDKSYLDFKFWSPHIYSYNQSTLKLIFEKAKYKT